MKKVLLLLLVVSNIAIAQTFPVNNLQVNGTANFTGAVSGAGFTTSVGSLVNAALQSPGVGIGSGTPSTGAFTSLSSTAAPTVGAATIYPTVANNAALAALSTVTVGTVTRLGFYTAGDAPPLVYQASGSACSLNSGAGDNGSQVRSADNKCWLANFPTNGVSVSQYGAKGDGTTDDTAAINTALTDSPSIVYLDAKAYRTASGIAVPAGKSLQGQNFGTYATGAITDSAPMIIGDLAVSPVVSVSAGSNTEGVVLSNVMVNRAAGTIPANSVSVAITNSNNTASVQDVFAARSAVGFAVGGGSFTSLGIHCLRCYTARISQYHVSISNAVETTFTDARFGTNGGTDLNATAYVNIAGSLVDTVRFQSSQFNISLVNGINYLLKFTGYTDPTGVISFDNCHAEQMSSAVVTADAGTTSVNRVRFIGNSLDAPSSSLFYDGAANKFNNWILTGNSLFGGYSMTLDQQSNIVMSGNVLQGNLIVNAGSQVITGNFFQGNVTLAGASVKTIFVGNGVSGSISNTMTGASVIANNL